MYDFAEKRKALFNCLDDASKELEGTSLDQTNAEKYTEREFRGRSRHNDDTYPSSLHNRGRRSSSERRPNLSALRGKESIFKKQQLPLIKCLKPRRTPDYQLNPHKWQKYSLADVDISDQTNKSAAFAFLRQIEQQRDDKFEAIEDDDPMAAAERKIEFRKSSHIKRSIKAVAAGELVDVEVDRPKLKGSKFVMPQYVVGQKQERKTTIKKINKSQNRAVGTLKLSHLMATDDDDDAIEER